jgi:hypothetical protein
MRFLIWIVTSDKEIIIKAKEQLSGHKLFFLKNFEETVEYIKNFDNYNLQLPNYILVEACISKSKWFNEPSIHGILLAITYYNDMIGSIFGVFNTDSKVILEYMAFSHYHEVSGFINGVNFFRSTDLDQFIGDMEIRRIQK